MITPKEKAKELVDKFYPYVQWKMGQEDCLDRAKQCALIAVNEMIMQNGELYLNGLGDKTIEFYKAKNAYLFEVKKEIENQ